MPPYHQHKDSSAATGVSWEGGLCHPCLTCQPTLSHPSSSTGLWRCLHRRWSSPTLTASGARSHGWAPAASQGPGGAVGPSPGWRARPGSEAEQSLPSAPQACGRFQQRPGSLSEKTRKERLTLNPGKPVYFHCILILRDCLPRPRLSHGKEKPGSVTRGETCPRAKFPAPDVPPQQQKPEYFSSQQCPRGSAGGEGMEGEDGTHISSCSSRTSPASLDAERCSPGAGKGMVSPWEPGSRGAAAEGTCLKGYVETYPALLCNRSLQVQCCIYTVGTESPGLDSAEA